jgi:hypothetical protein
MGALPASANDPAKLPPAAEGKIDFTHDIQPLLRKNCFSCHGDENQEGGLRLDQKQRALAGGDTGAAIVPGKSAESRIVYLLAGLDEDSGLMPPAGKGTPFTPAEIGLVRAWIDQGAVWPTAAEIAASGAGHWSLQPIANPPLPAVKEGEWLANPIDAFVLARLERKQIAHSEPADREHLLRRVYLDLIGLPPTPDEVARFLADARPDAYERLIDRLLASPHYGERRGRHWLDLARYADSDGYEKDRPRPFAWRYRDWVIAALNADMPYSQFTIEQIAGDLLPEATLAQKTASGFHRNTLHNTEGGIDPEEDRVKKTVDRTNTVSTIWLGLSLGCAQCHSHKYDPISQREYYSMYAFFNSLNETDIPAPSPADEARLAQQKQAHERELSRRQAAVKQYEEKELSAAQAAWEAMAMASPAVWQTLDHPQAKSAKGASFKLLDDDSLLASGKNILSDVYTIEAAVPSGKFTALRLEVLPDASLPANGPGRSKNGNFVLATLRVSASPASGGAAQDIQLTAARADFAQTKFEPMLAINDKAADGWAVSPQFGKRHVAVFEAKEPFGFDAGTKLTITLDQSYNQKQPHNIGRFRLSVTEAPAPVELEGVPVNVAQALAAPRNKRSAEQRKLIADHYRTVDSKLVSLRQAVTEHQAKAPKLPDDMKAQAVVELNEPRLTKIHLRGDFLAPGDAVSVGTLAVLPPLAPREKTPDRLDLARWLVADANPLPARVMVNRLWQQLFGRGIVATSDDFGKQGDLPSHPLLLDWLATDFRIHGWSLKRLERAIVQSATYRQSAVARGDLREVDPENALLARQTRRRVESELIRDVALQASGLLATHIGGPSVHPPQPAEYSGLTYANSAKWVESNGGDRYRRGMYTFFQRTSPYPMLLTFDAPDSNECTVHRTVSNTPLQALTLWNDPVFFECAQALAHRIAGEQTTSADELQTARHRAAFAFLCCLGREPDSAELADVLELYQSQLKLSRQNPAATEAMIGARDMPPDTSTAELAAWVSVSRALLNLDEFITRE